MKTFDATQYTANVRPFEEDGEKYYFAWFSQLGEGIHAIADTPEVALRNAYESLAELAVAADEAHSPLPEPDRESCESFSGHFSIRVSRFLHHELAHCAKREGVSLNSYVHESLARHATWCRITGVTLRDFERVRTTTAFSQMLPSSEYDELKTKPLEKLA